MIRILASLLMLITISANAQTIQLFQPGQSSFEWLLSEHEGGKSLRKGMECQQCHDASDKEMFSDSLAVDMSLAQNDSEYLITLSWKSSATSVDASIMLDSNQVTAFQKTGCWASCHGDMTGMDQSMDLPKYLGASRKKLTRSGGGNNTKEDAALKELMAKGEFVELWHAKAGKGSATVTQATILESPLVIQKPTVEVSASAENGQWSVTFRQRKENSGGKGLSADGEYTVGVAIHQNNKGHDHWVSLPVSLVLKNGKLDFAGE